MEVGFPVRLTANLSRGARQVGTAPAGVKLPEGNFQRIRERPRKPAFFFNARRMHATHGT